MLKNPITKTFSSDKKVPVKFLTQGLSSIIDANGLYHTNVNIQIFPVTTHKFLLRLENLEDL
jgi:hypothetical protein